MIAKLRQARLDAGMTQTEVAEILKEPQTFVSKVELGERRIDPLELVELAELYGKPTASFLP